MAYLLGVGGCSGKPIATMPLDAGSDTVGGGPGNDAASGPGGGLCSSGGWCWVNPTPQGNGLRGVWGLGADDVWDGTAWSTGTSGTGPTPRSIWGSGATNVWAVTTDGLLLHSTGGDWSAASQSGVTVLQLSSVWGNGPDDIWAAGPRSPSPLKGNGVYHWDGAAWSVAQTGGKSFFFSVWGSGRDDVWAVGNDGAIAHWDGVIWAAVPSGTTDALTDVWGTGPNDVWAIGGRNPSLAQTILHWDGTAWSVSRSVQSKRPLSTIWGSSPSDVWTGGQDGLLHWDGTTWSDLGVVGGIAAGSGVSGIWGSGPNDVWAVTGKYDTATSRRVGVALHYDGSAWSAMHVNGSGALTAVSGTAANDVWAVASDGASAHWDGTSWTAVATGATLPLYAVWASPAETWAVGDNGAILRIRHR